MEKLVCEICGGRLIMGQKDTFECESCGSCYSREWVKQKVQEIQGTVKVEGTVQVEGSVKLDGPVEVKGGPSVQNYLDRGQLALKDGQFNEAKDFFEKALDLDGKSVDAYLGLFCTNIGIRSVESPIYDWGHVDSESARLYGYACQFAAPDRSEQLLELKKEKIQNYLDKEAEKAAKEAAEVAKYNAARSRCAAADGMILAKYSNVYALKVDGTVLVTGSNKYGQCDAGSWKCITQIAASDYHIVGLRIDGTVVAAGDNDRGQCNVDSWRNIVEIAATPGCTLGRRSDGTVLLAGKTFLDKPPYKEMEAVQSLSRKPREKGKPQAIWWNGGGSISIKLLTDGTVDYDLGDCSRLSNHNQGLILLAYKETSQWVNIVEISVGTGYQVAGICADGQVVIAGTERGINVNGWKLFASIDTLPQERAENIARMKEELRREEEDRLKNIEELTQKKLAAQKELGSLGFLAFKRKKELEDAIAYYDREITKLGG